MALVPDLLLPARTTTVGGGTVGRAADDDVEAARIRKVTAGSASAVSATSAIPRPAFSVIISCVKPNSLCAMFSRLRICSAETVSMRRLEGRRQKPRDDEEDKDAWLGFLSIYAGPCAIRAAAALDRPTAWPAVALALAFRGCDRRVADTLLSPRRELWRLPRPRSFDRPPSLASRTAPTAPTSSASLFQKSWDTVCGSLMTGFGSTDTDAEADAGVAAAAAAAATAAADGGRSNTFSVWCRFLPPAVPGFGTGRRLCVTKRSESAI